MTALRRVASYFLMFLLCVLPVAEAELSFLRYGTEFMIYDPLPTTMEALVAQARYEAADPTISRFFTTNGRPVRSLNDLPKKVVALDYEEHFVWPFIKEGYKHDVSTLTDRPDLELISLAESPRAFEVRNFLSSDECDLIVRLADRKGLVDSTIILGPGEDPKEFQNTRTSKGTFLDYYSNPLLRRIAKRAANLTAVAAHHSEDMQVIHYDPATHYWAHHDWIGYEAAAERNSWNSVQNGYYDDNRFVTLVFYLNDVDSGGHTAFPYTNPAFDPVTEQATDAYCKESYPCLRVKPKKGNAAMFYNLQERTHMMGDVDEHSLHAGCDPAEGAEKWAANFWVHVWPWRAPEEIADDEALRREELDWLEREKQDWEAGLEQHMHEESVVEDEGTGILFKLDDEELLAVDDV